MVILDEKQMAECTGGLKINWEKVMCSGYYIGMSAVIGFACPIGGIVVSVLGTVVCNMV